MIIQVFLVLIKKKYKNLANKTKSKKVTDLNYGSKFNFNK